MRLQSAKQTDKFDFTIGKNREIEMVDNGLSVANMLKLDLNSNNGWILDSLLGLEWINEDNTGLMQLKNNDVTIAVAVQSKLYQTDGIQTVNEVSVVRDVTRNLIMEVDVTTTDGERFVTNISMDGGNG